jgi:restriction endonuclease Mrr
VERAVVTSYSADEGIDFYGRWPLERHIFPEDIFPTLQRQLSVWMVGQAKHYKATQVSTPDLRGLVGAVTLARGKAFGSGLPDKYQDLNLKPCDPVFCLFFTTGQISSDGWRLLHRSGVVGMDGEMVAAFLADRDIGVKEGSFDAVAFSIWLKQVEAN